MRNECDKATKTGFVEASIELDSDCGEHNTVDKFDYNDAGQPGVCQATMGQHKVLIVLVLANVTVNQLVDGAGRHRALLMTTPAKILLKVWTTFGNAAMFQVVTGSRSKILQDKVVWVDAITQPWMGAAPVVLRSFDSDRATSIAKGHRDGLKQPRAFHDVCLQQLTTPRTGPQDCLPDNAYGRNRMNDGFECSSNGVTDDVDKVVVERQLMTKNRRLRWTTATLQSRLMRACRVGMILRRISFLPDGRLPNTSLFQRETATVLQLEQSPAHQRERELHDVMEEVMTNQLLQHRWERNSNRWHERLREGCSGYNKLHQKHDGCNIPQTEGDDHNNFLTVARAGRNFQWMPPWKPELQQHQLQREYLSRCRRRMATGWQERIMDGAQQWVSGSIGYDNVGQIDFD